MFRVTFLLNARGESAALNYILSLKEKSDKSSRIKYNKINDYLTALSNYGLKNPEKIIKHLIDDIWELRPLRDRFLFAPDSDSFIILHWFRKKSRKTPKKEIEKAKLGLSYYLEQEVNNDAKDK